jgi:hypothetical protein
MKHFTKKLGKAYTNDASIIALLSAFNHSII